MRIKQVSYPVLLVTGAAAIVFLWIRYTELRLELARVEEENAKALAALTQPLEDEPPELAPFMSNLSRYTHKLGLAIYASNQELSLFYLEEVEESLEEIAEKVPVHDGLPIRESIQTIIEPTYEPVKKGLQAQEWRGAREAYQVLVQACNRCHAATEHKFIELASTNLPAIFPQRF